MKRRLLPVVLTLAAVFALGTSCSFDFGDDGKDITPPGDEANWTYETVRYTGTVAETAVDVEVTKATCDGVFKYTTEAYIDSDGHVYQMQQYDAAGALESVESYAYAQAGDPLAWRQVSRTDWSVETDPPVAATLTVYGYGAEAAVETETVYELSVDAANPSWCARYEMDETATPPLYEASLWTADSLDLAEPLPELVSVRGWLTESDTESAHWNFAADYRRSGGSASLSMPEQPKPCVMVPETASTDAIDPATLADVSALYHGAIALTAVTDPGYAVPVLPDPAAPGIDAEYYGIYEAESAVRTTELAFDGDWYPTSMVRTDDRLPASLTIEADWDENHRITEKRTFVGSTLALSIGIERDDDGYPTTIETGGEGLTVPLDYGFVYADGTHNLERITFGAEGVGTLQSLAFEFKGGAPVTLPSLSAEGLKSFDPFAFMNEILTNELVIKHYDGSDNVVELFGIESDASGVTATVYDAKLTADLADDVVTGSYVASWASEGAPVASLAALDEDGDEIWSYSYDYGDAIATAAEDAIPAGFDLSALDAESQLSAFFSDETAEDAEAMAQSILNGFAYDLLF